MKLYSRDQIIKQYPNKNFSSGEFWLVASDGQSIGTNNLDEFDKFFAESKGMFYVDGPDRYTRTSSLINTERRKKMKKLIKVVKWFAAAAVTGFLLGRTILVIRLVSGLANDIPFFSRLWFAIEIVFFR